eukprot:16223-Rhodomonas_salina.1
MSGLTGPMCAARVWEMSAIVLLGILGGLLGALMVVLNGYGLARWRKVSARSVCGMTLQRSDCEEEEDADDDDGEDEE